MFCWPETTAKRGSDEVISCIHDTLSQLPPEITSLCLYPDGCGGQNKNTNVMWYLFSLVAIGDFNLFCTFPVWGQSFLPNDHDFGWTEVNKRKNKRMYTPTERMDVIRHSHQCIPFRVVQADQSTCMFLNLDLHVTPISIRHWISRRHGYWSTLLIMCPKVWMKYNMKDDVNWSKLSTCIMKFCATPSLPSSDQTKYSGILSGEESSWFEEDCREIRMHRKSLSHTMTVSCLVRNQWEWKLIFMYAQATYLLTWSCCISHVHVHIIENFNGLFCTCT